MNTYILFHGTQAAVKAASNEINRHGWEAARKSANTYTCVKVSAMDVWYDNDVAKFESHVALVKAALRDGSMVKSCKIDAENEEDLFSKAQEIRTSGNAYEVNPNAFTSSLSTGDVFSNPAERKIFIVLASGFHCIHSPRMAEDDSTRAILSAI